MTDNSCAQKDYVIVNVVYCSILEDDDIVKPNLGNPNLEYSSSHSPLLGTISSVAIYSKKPDIEPSFCLRDRVLSAAV